MFKCALGKCALHVHGRVAKARNAQMRTCMGRWQRPTPTRNALEFAGEGRGRTRPGTAQDVSRRLLLRRPGRLAERGAQHCIGSSGACLVLLREQRQTKYKYVLSQLTKLRIGPACMFGDVHCLCCCSATATFATNIGDLNSPRLRARRGPVLGRASGDTGTREEEQG